MNAISIVLKKRSIPINKIELPGIDFPTLNVISMPHKNIFMIGVAISVSLAFLFKNQDKQANTRHTPFMFNPSVIDNVPLKKPIIVK